MGVGVCAVFLGFAVDGGTACSFTTLEGFVVALFVSLFELLLLSDFTTSFGAETCVFKDGAA